MPIPEDLLPVCTNKPDDRLLNKDNNSVKGYLPAITDLFVFRLINKIENIIREEMNAIGGREVLMPTLNPKENWEKTGRWSSMDDLYKLKDSSEREFALGGTHEEVIVPLAKKFVCHSEFI